MPGPDPDSLSDALAVMKSATEIVSSVDIDNAFDRMSAEIAAHVADSNPTILAVMQGGVFTATQLCRRFTFPCRFDFVHGSRYGDELEGSDLNWRVPPSVNLAGRTVVIVDDILDRGLTLADLQIQLAEIGVKKAYSAVLVSKRLHESIERPFVDFVGLQADDVFLFGCGMDYKGYWRGLSSLFAVTTR